MKDTLIYVYVKETLDYRITYYKKTIFMLEKDQYPNL